jgi:DNA-binding CsgD family transcriptional regulator
MSRSELSPWFEPAGAGSPLEMIIAGRTGRVPSPTKRGTPTSTPSLSAPEAWAFATLDKLNRGVLLIDAVGGRDAARRYEQFLASAADLDGSACLMLCVAAPSHREDYRVLVSPLNSDGDRTAAAYCVFIYEPGAGHRPLPAKVLAQLYGLTPSEARLVNALFVGSSLRDAAQQVGVTLNTAKSTLKKAFAKCEVGSQAELLQLLALGPRTL